jgi:hypothetical protein
MGHIRQTAKLGQYEPPSQQLARRRRPVTQCRISAAQRRQRLAGRRKPPGTRSRIPIGRATRAACVYAPPRPKLRYADIGLPIPWPCDDGLCNATGHVHSFSSALPGNANRQDLREPGRNRNNHACLVGLSSTKRHELHECCSDPHPYSWHSYNSWFKLCPRPTAGLGVHQQFDSTPDLHAGASTNSNSNPSAAATACKLESLILQRRVRSICSGLGH